MQGEWARRQGQDLCAGGGSIGRRLSINTTHGIVDKHADNCINTSASASTNTVKNASASSAIFKQNDNGIYSAKAKAGTAKTIFKARRRPAALPAAPTPAPAALPSPWRGWHARTLAMAMTTTTKTKSKGRRRDDDCQGQEEPAVLHAATAPAPPALPLTWGRWHARMSATATATMTKTKTGPKTATGTKMRLQGR